MKDQVKQQRNRKVNKEMKKLILAAILFVIASPVFAVIPILPFALPEVSEMTQPVKEQAMRFAEQDPVLRYWLYRKITNNEFDAAAQEHYIETCILLFVATADMESLLQGANDLGMDVTTPRPPLDIPNTRIQAGEAYATRRATMQTYVE